MDPGTRVFVGIHGFEPAGWAQQAVRALAAWPGAVVHVAVVIDVPAPPHATLLPVARRRYAQARTLWREHQEARVAPTVQELLAALPPRVETSTIVARRSDPGRALAEAASAWKADTLVVGPHRSSSLARSILGAVHEQAVRYATCAVLVTPVAQPRPWHGWRRTARSTSQALTAVRGA